MLNDIHWFMMSRFKWNSSWRVWWRQLKIKLCLYEHKRRLLKNDSTLNDHTHATQAICIADYPQKNVTTPNLCTRSISPVECDNFL
jgi:hypothetical protein